MTALFQGARADSGNLLLVALEGHTDRVNSVDWLPDGRLVTASNDHTVRIWDVGSARLLRTLEGFREPALAVAAHPEGKFLATGGKDRTVKLWDLESSEGPREVATHGKSVLAVAFSPDGKWLASCGEDDNRIALWNVAEAKSHKQAAAEDADDKNQRRSMFCVAFSPDSKSLVTGSADRTLRLWDVESVQERKRFEAVDYFLYTQKDKTIERTAKQGAAAAPVYAAAFRADGTRIAASSADKTIRIWNVASGELLQSLEGQPDYVYSLAWLPDGRLVSLGHRGHLQVWTSAGELQKANRLSAPAQAMACSAAGGQAAFACADGKAYVLDLAAWAGA